jgi:1,4-dihydroxy-2-naphthoate octaprenyltransferase
MELSVWILASRPKTLSAAFCPVTAGSLLALRDGSFDFVVFLITLCTALGIQIGTNLANDYFDFEKGADTAERKGPLRVTQAGLVSPHTMKRAIFLCFTLTALLSSYLVFRGGPIIALLSSLSILLGLAYTAGPFPLAYLGLGEIFVFLFFGPIATLGTYYLQTHFFSWEAICFGMGIGLVSTAILVANNLRDIDEDRKAGKKTLCVRFGKNFGIYEYTACLLGAFVFPLWWGKILPLLVLPFAVYLIRQAMSDHFLSLLPRTASFLIFYTLLLIL